MNVFSRLSFKVKLLFLCVFLSAVSIIVGTVGFLALQKVESSYDRITEGTMPNLNILNNMFLSYRSVRINLRTLGLPGLPEDQAKEAVLRTTEAIEHYEKFDKAYNDIPFVPGEKELYDEVDKNWKHFKGVGENALSLYKAGTPESRAKLMRIFFEDCPKAAKDYTVAINNLKEFHEKNADRFENDSRKIGNQANQTILLIAVLGILIGLLAGFVFSNRISKAISLVTSSLTENAEQVTTASSQIEAASVGLSEATTEQAASIQETSAALEEITAMIAKASENAAVTSTSSNESQEKAEEGRQAVEQMMSSMTEISDSNDAIMNQVNESNQQMTEIVRVIQDIGNKTKVINEIVFQTKLLSFNASVEAARAGEHGKGFAVVAEEVGNLAQMSGNAAKEISDMLNSSIPKVESIVENTKSRVENLIGEARVKVQAGSEVAQKCANTLNEIVQNVNRVSGLAQEISSASKEQSQGVSEINKAMAQLDTVTQQNSSTSEQAAASAKELAKQSVSLKLTVTQLAALINGENKNSTAVPPTLNHASRAANPSQNVETYSGLRSIQNRRSPHRENPDFGDSEAS